MSLKSSIVLVNEFSVPKMGGGGSRGGTPGSYVTRYMAREDAVESLAPIQRLRTDDFIVRYMARESAVERAPSSAAAKTQMRQAQGEGGLAFGYGSVSLSDEQLTAASRDIQKHFDNGKTVMKTVLSFDEDYLKRRGIVSEDFHCAQRGDYRGHIDQMKLRMAIMHGMDRMAAGSGGFDDLRYVATIQVDTEHVHCHIAAVDAGVGRLANDGTQRGKLLDRHKSRLRRGVDAWLDEKQMVAHMSSAVGYERRNVTTYIKRWAYERIRSEALPQFILACLPADRNLWRAGSNRPEMRKANQLVTELVTEQLERPGSPMPAAMERIVDYANTRRRNEDLPQQHWEQLVESGRGQILERAVNGVYGLLRAMDQQELTVRTPMLEVMGMDYDQIASMMAQQQSSGQEQDPAQDLVSFGFRLRSYASRLDHHRGKAGRYESLAKQWERAEVADVAAEDSRPLYDFHRHEAIYHRRLMSKYQHFLPILTDASAWYDQQQQVSNYGASLLALMSMRADASLTRMKDGEEAERLGREIYDQPGGRHLTQGQSGRMVLDGRITKMRAGYEERIGQLRSRLAGEGLVLQLDVDDQGREQVTDDARIIPGTTYGFDEVKGLDLHHLSYDFVSDVEVGSVALEEFAETSRQRRHLFLDAMGYLEGSGQSEAISDLPVSDVAAMTRTARALQSQRTEDGSAVLRSRIAELRAEQDRAAARRSATTSLDAQLAVRVTAEVDQAVLQDSAGPAGPEPEADQSIPTPGHE